MAFNGSGTFNRLYNWVNDRDNNIKILASKMDQEMDGFATGLSNCITRNGESAIISNISLNNYKLTGLANGSSRTDSINIGQVQDGTYTYLGLTNGSADAYTLAPSTTITSYLSSHRFAVKIHATNATTTPYLQISAIVNPTTTAVIKKLSETKAEIAVEASDLLADGIYDFQRNSANDAWIVLNPEKASNKATTTFQGINYLSLPTNPITAGNNSSTPNTDIDFFVGTMTFSDGSGQALSTAMTKRLQATGSWSAGNNNNMLLSGARANNSTYHLFAMYKTDGTVDYGALLGVAGTDPNPTSNLPSGYTKYQRIGSILTDASGNIRSFYQIGKKFKLGGSKIENRATSAPPTTATNQTVSVPVGIEVDAISIVALFPNSATGATYLIVEPTTHTATTPTSTNYTVYSQHGAGSPNSLALPLITKTNKSAQILINANISTSHNLQILSDGWIDFNLIF
jgi:hypothetical protein